MEPTVPSTVESALDRLGNALDDDMGLITVRADGTVASISPTARTLFELAPDLAGRHLNHVGLDHRVIRAVMTCLSSGAPQRRAITTAEWDLEVHAFTIDDSGGVVVVIRDLRDPHSFERTRRDFATNVSHELRTPITAIRLLVDTLEKGALADVEAAPRFIHDIGREARYLQQMVEGLLDLATIEGGGPLPAKPVPVAEVFDHVERLRPLADERGVSLTMVIEPDTPDVLGDASRLGQVMRNLAHNAIKFTPAGGAITLAADHGEGATVEFVCRDTGVGIAAEHLARIFERFWKADASRQRTNLGSGLGLAISRHIVEAYDGTIRAESVRDRGSTFTVTLPAADGALTDG